MERIIWRDAAVNGNTTEVKEDKYGRKKWNGKMTCYRSIRGEEPTWDKVMEMIKDLKKKKALGKDTITTEMVANAGEILWKSLHSIL